MNYINPKLYYGKFIDDEKIRIAEEEYKKYIFSHQDILPKALVKLVIKNDYEWLFHDATIIYINIRPNNTVFFRNISNEVTMGIKDQENIFDISLSQVSKFEIIKSPEVVFPKFYETFLGDILLCEIGNVDANISMALFTSCAEQITIHFKKIKIQQHILN